MNPQMQNNHLLQNNRERRTRWPILFWIVLKVLGTFYHRSVVTKRNCYHCHVKSITEGRSLGRLSKLKLDFDRLNLEYELDSEEELSVGIYDRAVDMDQANEVCEVCETLWWDDEGVPIRYTQREIGK